MRVFSVLRRAAKGTVRFFQRRGTALVTTGCVGVITAAVLWYPSFREEDCPPTPAEDLAAARLVQQTLPPPSAQPSASPAPWIAPMAAWQLLQPFDLQTMYRGETGIWRVHDAAVLAGQPGGDVRAMADGAVVSVAEDAPGRRRIVLDHGGGITAEYAGLAETRLTAGTTVRAGQVVGCLPGGDSPALQLRVTRDGSPVDPTALFRAE